jgi:hypothetical protein
MTEDEIASYAGAVARMLRWIGPQPRAHLLNVLHEFELTADQADAVLACGFARGWFDVHPYQPADLKTLPTQP